MAVICSIGEISCFSLVQLPKTAIAVSDDIAVFGDIVPCPIAENGYILENSFNT